MKEDAEDKNKDSDLLHYKYAVIFTPQYNVVHWYPAISWYLKCLNGGPPYTNKIKY